MLALRQSSAGGHPRLNRSRTRTQQGVRVYIRGWRFSKNRCIRIRWRRSPIRRISVFNSLLEGIRARINAELVEKEYTLSQRAESIEACSFERTLEGSFMSIQAPSISIPVSELKNIAYSLFQNVCVFSLNQST